MHFTYILASVIAGMTTVSASPLSAYGELPASNPSTSLKDSFSSTRYRGSTKADLSAEATSKTSSCHSSHSTTSRFAIATGKSYGPLSVTGLTPNGSGHISASGTTISGGSTPTTAPSPYSNSTGHSHYTYIPSGVSAGASLSPTAGALSGTSSIPAGIFPSGQGPQTGAPSGRPSGIPLSGSSASSSVAGPVTVTVTAPAITITDRCTKTVTVTAAASSNIAISAGAATASTPAVISAASGHPSLSAHQSAPYPVANATMPHPTASGNVSGSISISRPSGSAVASHPSASKPVTHTHHRTSTKSHHASKPHRSTSVAISAEAAASSSSSKTFSKSSSSSVSTVPGATLSSYV